jgi:hypothetical protein
VVGALGDTTFESDETYFVELANPVGALIDDDRGIGGIENDDTRPSLAISDVVVAEGNSGTKSALFDVTLDKTYALPVTVSY